MAPQDIIIKTEPPDDYEENIENNWAPVHDDDLDAAVAAVDENLRIYGVRVWPHICNTVKLKTSTPERRELMRKCTGYVLKTDPDVHDRSIAKYLVARYTEHKLSAGTINRFAIVVRNKIKPKNGRAIPLVEIDDDGAESPTSEDNIGGIFPRVEVDEAEFHKCFCLFFERLHKAFLIELPEIESKTVEEMVVEAFKGEKTIRAIAGRRVKVAHLRRICNAVAQLCYAHEREKHFTEEEKAAAEELRKFLLKYGFFKDPKPDPLDH